MRRFVFALSSSLTLALSAGCDDGQEQAAQAAASASAAAAASASAAAAAAEAEREATPGPCQAAGSEPAKLGVVHGDVHGFGLGKSEVYYSSWSVYGGRGDVGSMRKDGKGSRSLASLSLEPRDLALDDEHVFFTTGIRMMKVPRAGGEAQMIAEVFASQDVAVDATHVYGVPGDYGPYDRIAKLPKKGGGVDDIHGDKRPKIAEGPNGYSRIAVADGKLYVTDSGRGRLLQMAPKDDEPTVVVQGQPQAFELAIVGPDVVFNLARKGHLMKVSRDGGAAKRIASGLAPDAQVAANGAAAFSILAGKTEDDPVTIAQFDLESGEPKPLATVPALEPVPALAADDACVYWAQRKSASETIVFARKL